MNVSIFIGIVVAIFQTVNGQGGPNCPGAPTPCYPVGNPRPGPTCITPAKPGKSTNWYKMEDACKPQNGRLVWLREDLSITALLTTSVKGQPGVLVATGLLSSPSNLGGLFWRNPNDNSSLLCDTTDTRSCMVNSTEDTCTAIGCCWKNKGQCQYPSNQTLPAFNVNKAELNVSTSTERQCVGFQLNANSSIPGQWVTYDCFKPVIRNAVFVCEYKCNSPDWPKTNTTNFMSLVPPGATTEPPGNGVKQTDHHTIWMMCLYSITIHLATLLS